MWASVAVVVAAAVVAAVVVELLLMMMSEKTNWLFNTDIITTYRAKGLSLRYPISKVIRISKHTHTHTHIHTHTHTLTCSHTHTHIHTYTQTHTHSHAHTHKHKHKTMFTNQAFKFFQCNVKCLKLNPPFFLLLITAVLNSVIFCNNIVLDVAAVVVVVVVVATSYEARVWRPDTLNRFKNWSSKKNFSSKKFAQTQSKHDQTKMHSDKQKHFLKLLLLKQQTNSNKNWLIKISSQLSFTNVSLHWLNMSSIHEVTPRFWILW